MISLSIGHEGACASHVRSTGSTRSRPSAALRTSVLSSRPRMLGRYSCVCAAKKASKPSPEKTVDYGSNWFTATKERRFSTAREEMEWRREANLKANNGKERKDLYTDNWDGDKYKGNPVNVLSVILVISVLVPLAGLGFAYWSYGILWG